MMQVIDIKKIMQRELHIVLLRDSFVQGMKYSYEEYLVDFFEFIKTEI